MKKLVLLVTFLLCSHFTFSQSYSQPSIYNNICDTDNDGFAEFYLEEISYEILAGLNSSNFTVTHHETQSDANLGVNILVAPYQNSIPNSQILFARITNLTTNEVQIISYPINVNPSPQITGQVLTQCASAITMPQCWDLASLVPNITESVGSSTLTFHETLTDAQVNANVIANPSCYHSLNVSSSSVVFYRIESTNGCSSIGEVVLAVVECNQIGYAQSFIQCVDSGFGCFNLNNNNQNIFGTLNQQEYTLTYHASQMDADDGENPLSSPYCATSNNQIIYARLLENDTLNSTILTFSIITNQITSQTTTLTGLIQCDENGDGTIVFDLTSVQSQINSSNQFQYYLSYDNALSQTSQISNPNAFNVASTTQNTAIFVREIFVNDCDNIYTFNLLSNNVCNLAYTCNQANSLCASLGVPFSNTVGVASTGPRGCLGTTPNPTWFFIPISNTGNINLQIEQSSNINFNGNGLDVDFIAYGPFDDPVTPCTNGLSQSNTIACSYSANFIENFTIPAIAGKYYLIMVTNFSNQNGFIKITQTNNSEGTINCSGLVLNAFLDSNNNGTKDSTESNFPLGQFQYEVNDNDVVHNITSPTGVYNIYEINPNNSYDLGFTINPEYASLYNVTTSAYNNVNVIVGSGMTMYNFPVTVVTPYNDLAVAVIPYNAPRPGFTYTNKVVYSNLGNQIIPSGTVSFTKDSNVTITSTTPTGVTMNTTGFTQNFTNLAPFEIRTIDVVMQIPTIPTVQAGQYLTNSANISPLNGDVVPENNTNSLAQEIVNAYDPNDKMEARGEEILITNFTSNDYLYYTIRFENTGTASAINVRVTDVLDDKLNKASMQMVSSSHNYILDRIDDQLTWRFNNIQLPVSVANTNIGKGYITFKIKPMPGYAVGDIIPNTAAIYFDFNPPIITNTFNTLFVAPLAIDQFESNNVIFYPNPTDNFVTVTLNETSNLLKQITVFDVLGKQIFEVNTNTNSQTIDLSNVQSGIYFVEVETQNNSKMIKKVIVK